MCLHSALAEFDDDFGERARELERHLVDVALGVGGILLLETRRHRLRNTGKARGTPDGPYGKVNHDYRPCGRTSAKLNAEALWHRTDQHSQLVSCLPQCGRREFQA